MKLILHDDSQGQELPQRFKNSSIPPFVEELFLFKVNPAEIILSVLVNIHTLITQFFYSLKNGQISNNNKVTKI